MSELSVLDTFAGAGGFSLGFEQAGFNTHLQVVQMRGAPEFVRPVIKGVAVRP